MDLQGSLIESKRQPGKGGWKSSAASLVIHGALISTLIFLGATTTHKVDAEDKPIRAFVTQGAAPPPPPPPPPPAPALSSGAPKTTPRVQPKIEQPKPIPHDAFIPPREIPKEVPQTVAPVTTEDVQPSDDLPASSAPAAVEGGVAGGVAGGVVGGVQGGVVGGEIGGVQGGEIGGVKGGEIGGVLGGKVGGTGAGLEGDGTGDKNAIVIPEGPVRVGGNVKAPTVIDRVEPRYTDPARAARVTGVVIVEAIIDRNGNVDRVRVIKGLPLGLAEEAERAVRQWKFKPGTMGGQPVDVIFNLTVNFKLRS